MRATLGLALVGLAAACAEDGTVVPLGGESDHSSSLAVSADGGALFVVNPDADSVSILDATSGAIVHEVLLAAVVPAVASDGRYEPAVEPRALALAPGERALYVTGHASGRVYAVDPASGRRLADAAVCSEPVGVVASPDGSTVFVACSQDGTVVALDAATLALRARVATSPKPWTLAWSADRATLLVTHLLGPGITALSPEPLATQGAWALADGPATPGAPTEPHGPVRGIYDARARPGSSEIWVASIMLGTDTPQPQLAFDMTAFPAVSAFDPSGRELARLSVTASPGDGGAFGDVTSGPRALAFSPDGRYAYVADTGSEDLLVIDAVRRVEATLVRPLPGHQPEGVAVGPDGKVYVHERNTSDVAVVTVEGGSVDGGWGPTASVVGRFPTVARDPMPSGLRLGQHLFYSANSDELPLTTDHWVSCASCHVEGRTDAVTWRFAQGPRDTPSNAGGVANTGFLFRTAARNRVADYWQTIDTEQGGHFSTAVPALAADLEALEDYVNEAIPYPRPPSDLDAAQVTAGARLFASLGCAACHAGPYFTDSGAMNPSLVLSGPVVASPVAGGVVLHDVGTCVTGGPYDDVAVPDEDGDARGACAFDTPTLRGVGDSAPYLHDGRAAALEDVFRLAPAMVGPEAAALAPADLASLVAYLRSL